PRPRRAPSRGTPRPSGARARRAPPPRAPRAMRTRAAARRTRRDPSGSPSCGTHAARGSASRRRRAARRRRLPSACAPSLRADVEIRAGEDLVHLEDVRPAEHLARWPVRMRLGEVGALRPGDEVGEAAPPGFHLVVALGIRVLHPRAALMLELHRARAVDLVPDEARVAIDQVDAPLEAVLEVDLVPSGDGDADRKSTRLNSSHVAISYAVFCLKKKKEMIIRVGIS